MNRIPVIIESLCYLLSKLGNVDKIHLVKLMYLADRYHLMNYGRTISDDEFIALSNGPAGSKTMDVLEFDGYVLGNHLGMAKSLLKQGEGYQYLPRKKCEPDSLQMLSESDIEALDFVVDHFGTMDKWDVVDYTHKLPEWKQYKHLFESGKTKRESIKTDELLWIVIDKHFSVSEEHVQGSLEILTGTDA